MGFTRVTYNPTTDDGEVTNNRFHLLLPTRTYHQKLREQMAKQDTKAITAREVGWPRVDAPVLGTNMLMPMDERDARYGKPMLAFDSRPDRPPLLIVGYQQLHWQDLAERVAEYRHYEKPLDDGERAPDIQADWRERIELGLARRNGRSVFAFSKRDGLNKEWL